MYKKNNINLKEKFEKETGFPAIFDLDDNGYTQWLEQYIEKLQKEKKEIAWELYKLQSQHLND